MNGNANNVTIPKPLRDVDAVVAHLDKSLKKRKGL